MQNAIATSEEENNDIFTNNRRPAKRVRNSGWPVVARYVNLTVILAGIQFAWSVEMAYISPHLLSLGLDKDKLSLIWIAGPLSGVLVQPTVGYLSDRSLFQIGKRRPFIVGGCILACIGFLGLGETISIVSFLPVSNEKTAGIFIAILSLVACDVGINAMTACSRALIVDSLPLQLQEDANAWAGRMVGVGNVIGYLMGYVDLPGATGWSGSSQFEILCLMTVVVLLVTVSITCFKIKEDPGTINYYNTASEGPVNSSNDGTWLSSFATNVVQAVENFFKEFTSLSRRLNLIFISQFFVWIGWFAFLIWNTTWTAEMYFRDNRPAQFDNPDDYERLWVKATRIASLALMVKSVVAFATTVFMPKLIENTTNPDLSSSLSIKGFTLRRAWTLSHFSYACLAVASYFVNTTFGASVVVVLFGVAWGLANWAPFSLIATELSRGRTAILTHTETESLAEPLLHQQQLEENESQAAGAIFGIHNMFVSAPQFLSTVISSIIFRAFGREAHGSGPESVGWVIRVGG